MKEYKQTQKKKRDLSGWPKRILALLVMGFCLFVGAGSFHIVTDAFALWDPADLSSYAAVYHAVDDGYQSNLFTRRTQEDGEGGKPQPQQSQANQPETSRPEDNALKDALIDFNAIAGGALGAREMNGIIKLDNGYITDTLSEKQDMSHQITKTVEFFQYAQGQGKRFVFVMAPHLIDKYDPQLPTGVSDYYNECADEFMTAIAAAGVPTIDLREVMHNEGFDHYGGFFHTDRHWTPKTSAWAADRVMRELDAWGWLDTEGITVTPDDFVAVNEAVEFYGTAAERSGTAFAGTPDTLECLVPKEDLGVSLEYKRHDAGDGEYGDDVSFEDLYRDWEYADYDNTMDQMAYYMYTTMYEQTVLNESTPVNNHIMLVSDSFGVPFQSFLSCYVEKLTAFEGRWHVDFAAPVAQSDIVMVLYNPSTFDIRGENQTCFSFR